MLHKSILILSLAVTGMLYASPILQMNRAFMALTDLIPFITERDKFMDKKNSALIETKMTELQSAFKDAKHDPLMKEDLFAPSYALINENLTTSRAAFKAGNKDYAQWRLKEITSHCLDCHTRLPPSYTSSFQDGGLTIDAKKFDNTYNLGLAQLIVRRYPDATASFTRDIDEKLIKNEIKNLQSPFKQLLLIETKVMKNPKNIQSILMSYKEKKNLPEELRNDMISWLGQLKRWQDRPILEKGLQTDKEVQDFITKELQPLKKNESANNDVDLLFASGLFSNYLFLNPTSKKAPEITYWLGWAEKRLKKENFFGSGDLFLKQCIRRFPAHAVARDCLDEYRESVEFDFSGSSGTHIPQDVKKELDGLEKLIKKK